MKISSAIFSLLAATLCISAAAQEMPSRRHDSPAIERTVLKVAAVRIIEVAPLSGAKRAAPAEELRRLMRVGTVRDVAPQKRAPAWTADDQGGYALRTAVRSREAKGIRSRLEISRISPGMEIRVASHFGAIAEVMPLAAQAAGEIWTPYTDGDTQYIEVWSISDPRDLQVRLTGALHFDVSPALRQYRQGIGRVQPRRELHLERRGHRCRDRRAQTLRRDDEFCHRWIWLCLYRHAYQQRSFPRALLSDCQSLHFDTGRGLFAHHFLVHGNHGLRRRPRSTREVCR